MSSNVELNMTRRTAPIAMINVDSEDLLEIKVKEEITTNEPDPLSIEQSEGNSNISSRQFILSPWLLNRTLDLSVCLYVYPLSLLEFST